MNITTDTKSDIAVLLQQAEEGFSHITLAQEYKDHALANVQTWLTEAEFSEYVPQITHLIEQKHWEYLIDCFYQVIPFGTGGRRGEVGIGPNRINTWTIRSSAQGHSQYLLKKHGEEAKTRGVALAYDVRQFFTNKYFAKNLPNPVENLTGKHLAEAAAEVYVANGIKIYLFDSPRTTPELSFAIRYLNCIGGDVFSASHNPPEHNGKKVYDQFGGQLIPPEDERLVEEVQNSTEIKHVPFVDAVASAMVETIGEKIDAAYVAAVAELALTSARDLKIVFTPLHGCGGSSVLKVLRAVGFTVDEDPETSVQSGKFEHVTFNIPNPEVIQSFDTPLKFAKELDADIILNSDPDSDRIGTMVQHNGEWVFITGNEIAAILTEFVISKRKKQVGNKGVVVKTDVTTNLLTAIAKKHDMKIIGDLLVGFKYVGEVMNTMEAAGEIDNLLIGCEESHGYIAGNYVRDKDAAIAGLWLAECAAELKLQGKTLIDYLKTIYSTYGYFKNYLTEIRLPGAEGMTQIQKIQKSLRETPPTNFERFTIAKVEDWLDRLPIVSETDRVSKNGITLWITPVDATSSIKITIRPSGTEPKIKMYFEIGSKPFISEDLLSVQQTIGELLEEIEQAFMLVCYKSLGIEFPKRGFLLFWQLPLTVKLEYFKIEKDIVALKTAPQAERKEKLAGLLAFLGSDPIQKVDKAFAAEYGMGIEKYLEL